LGHLGIKLKQLRDREDHERDESANDRAVDADILQVAADRELDPARSEVKAAR
jgi:hypothetical protein